MVIGPIPGAVSCGSAGRSGVGAPSGIPSSTTSGRAILGVLAVPDFADAAVVLGAVAVQDRVQPRSSRALASGNCLLLMSGMGKSLPRSAPVRYLQRPGVGHDVDAAAHQQVADHRPRGRVVGHLVDADLVGAGAALQEEVVQQVELQVAAGEDVLPGPGVAHRVDRQGLLAAGDEVVANCGHSPSPASGVALGSVPRLVAPVSSRLIV